MRERVSFGILYMGYQLCQAKIKREIERESKRERDRAINDK